MAYNEALRWLSSSEASQVLGEAGHSCIPTEPIAS